MVNNSSDAACPRPPLLIQRAGREIPLIAEVRNKHSKLYAMTATQLQESIEIDRLEKLATH